jgi:hypothetical protein
MKLKQNIPFDWLSDMFSHESCYTKTDKDLQAYASVVIRQLFYIK